MIGYRSAFSNGVRWRINQGGLLPISPPAKLRDLDSAIAKRIMKENKSLFIRWESDFDHVSDGQWWHIIKDVADDISSLPKKTRYMIRSADKQFYARPAEKSEILTDGYNVYCRAYERYDTHERMYELSEFRTAVRGLPSQTEFWAIFAKSNHEMVAFSENYVEDSTCFYVTMWIDPVVLKKFAGYLLFYAMEQHYLVERGFRYLSDGARSISHSTNIHDFLIKKFLFRKAYARINIVYVPWLRLLIALFYPFRRVLRSVRIAPFNKASILLHQEHIRRKDAFQDGL